jgi:hypothetical protein
MTLDLRTRAFDAQIFGGKFERVTRVEDDAQKASAISKPELHRPGFIHG